MQVTQTEQRINHIFTGLGYKKTTSTTTTTQCLTQWKKVLVIVMPRQLVKMLTYLV